MIVLHLCLLLSALIPQDEGATLRTLKRAFQVARRPIEMQEQRESALKATAALDSKKLAESLLEACKNLEADIEELEDDRRSMVQAFNKKAANATRAEIDGLLRLEESLHARLIAQRSPEARMLQLEVALTGKKRGFGLRLALAGAAKHWDGELRVAALERLARKARTPGQRASLLVAIAATGKAAKSLAPRAMAQLGSDDATLRILSARALAAAPVPAAIEALIRGLEQQDQRSVRREFASALQQITRQKIGTSAAGWRDWLKREGGPFLAGEVVLGGGVAEVKGGGAGVDYHGLKLDGQRLIFTVDRSNSMWRTMDEPSRKLKDGEQGPELRIDRARAELIRTFGSFGKEMAFTLVTFAGDVQLFSDKLLAASARTVAKAQDYVREIPAQFATAVYDGLETSFYLAGREPGAAYWSPEVDAIILLSDGRPTVGSKGDDKQAILRAIRRWNPLQRVQVSVVGLGDEVPEKFLKNIAEQNAGQLVLERSR